jgi:hypothetical protein
MTSTACLNLSAFKEFCRHSSESEWYTDACCFQEHQQSVKCFIISIWMCYSKTGEIENLIASVRQNCAFRKVEIEGEMANWVYGYEANREKHPNLL